MSILFDAEDVERPVFDENRISNWIDKVITSHGKTTGDLAYLFCTDQKILEVNNQYLQHDYYTDIITFDYVEDNIISGDMIISLDTVKSNAELFKVNYDEELLRVIIHGVLHLCGFGDKSEDEEKRMRELENEALKLLTNN